MQLALWINSLWAINGKIKTVNCYMIFHTQQCCLFLNLFTSTPCRNAHFRHPQIWSPGIYPLVFSLAQMDSASFTTFSENDKKREENGKENFQHSRVWGFRYKAESLGPSLFTQSAGHPWRLKRLEDFSSQEPFDVLPSKITWLCKHSGKQNKE